MKNLWKKASAAIIILIVFVMTSPAFTAEMSSANYTIKSDVISGGGGESSSANYTVEHTTGQSTAIGESSSSNFSNFAGFWYTVGEVVGDTDGDGALDDVDNCIDIANADQADTDGDGVGDLCDNCVEVFNPDQRDTNSDEDDNAFIAGIQHYGNICDGDFDNSGVVEIKDFILWRPFAGQQTNPTNEDMDMNGNGAIWTDDFIIWRGTYGKMPGPGVTE